MTAQDDGPHPDRVSREEFSADPIEHARIRSRMSVAELVSEYGRAGIGARRLHGAVDIASDMFEADDVTVFMGLAGAMVPAGMRRVVSDLLRDGYIDVLVTTGANLTHDTIEAIGGKHHHGRDRNPALTAREHDERLREESIDRIYNVYLPQEHFTAFEQHLRTHVFPGLDGSVTIRELIRELGFANSRVNEERSIESDHGIAAAAAETGVPIFCPAVQDSILGLQAWLHSQTTDFGLDALRDMSVLNDIAHETDRSGAFLVGGGVPKNFVLQTMLVPSGAYDYAVQLTMDSPHTGGLTGATLDEARSWGKIEPSGRNETVYGDATITLPLVIAAVRDRLESSDRI